MQRIALLLVSAFVLLSLPVPPAAAACQFTPLVTVGGPNYPSDGVYLQQGCYWLPGPQRPEASASVDGGPPLQCFVVPPVFVAGQQVPGTGATYCVGIPSRSASVAGAAYPDVGVVVCKAGACSYVSTYYVNWACWSGFGNPGRVALPNGGSVTVDCTTIP